MDDTTKMVALLRRLKKEMNGAVVGAMQDRGVDYPLSFGVSVATIRDIAAAYAPDHSLAQLLFRQQVRELKLAAAFVDDPALVTPEQMAAWADGFDCAEIVEQTVWALFRHVENPAETVLAWMGSDRPLKLYAGLLTAASATSGNWCAGDPDAYFDAADRIARDDKSASEGVVSRGIIRLLLRLDGLSARWHERVAARIVEYASSSSVSLRHIAEESAWRIEYAKVRD